jgi:peptide/nickel transport system substrate-binding protein
MKSYYSFRVRNWYRRWQRNLKRWRLLIRRYFYAYIWRRTPRLKKVQRFAFGWLAVCGLIVGLLTAQLVGLQNYYLLPAPQSGGTYVEGMLGYSEAINPLFADNAVTRSANRLVFNGLVKFDGNGEIAPDLAESWEINSEANIYRFKLRPGVKWHDGTAFSAADVLFTIKTIQNPDTRSPQFSSWKDIKLSAPDEHTVEFQLPGAYAPFLTSLVQEIAPRHLLEGISPQQLRVASFNQKPVGTGPFKFDGFLPDQQEIRFKPNDDYFAGKPHLRQFIIKGFNNKQDLLIAQKERQLTASLGYDEDQEQELEGLPQVRVNTVPSSNQVFVFFNNQQAQLADRAVRQALIAAVDLNNLSRQFDGSLLTARSPLLSDQVGYNSFVTQTKFNLAEADKTLAAAGWVSQGGGRVKDGQKLSLELKAPNNDIYPRVAGYLKDSWQKLGVEVKLQLVETYQLQQSSVIPRKFDMLLYGINLGMDPDVYAYWHSSQIKDPGLNLSQYQSSAADTALEAGRTRLQAQLRAAKYEAFLRAWASDAPAMAVYRSNYYYVAREKVLNLNISKLPEAVYRYHNVEDWAVNTQPALKRLN